VKSRRAATAALLCTVLLTVGCATVPAGGSAPAPGDPWENFNRKVYAFNDTVDEAVMKPVAKAYKAVLPQLVRTGISNVLGNIGDVWSAANHLLQGKVHTGLDMGMRVVTNTLFGLGGLLDPATEMGLVRRSEDFGQTLGRWGVGPGPYLVLPLLGPSNVRDGSSLVVDRQFSASALVKSDNAGYTLTGVEVINLRAGLLDTTQLLDAVALDRYSFVRQAYLSRRLDLVYDGAPPMEAFPDDDPGDSPAKPAAAASAPTAAKPASAPAR
jgi:phospholipid-binding lipoprotein MlaA